MQIKWSDQSCRWFERASEYTGYNRRLADTLKKYIPAGENLCDIGCGAALVDFELAGHCREISCVDISPEAIAYVRERIVARGADNMSAVCSDVRDLDGRWDNVIALFFGGSGYFETCLSKAKKQLVIAVHASRKCKFGPEGHQVIKCSDIAGTKAYLDSRGLRYSFEEVSLEYGQPLESMDEAGAFARAYSRPMDDEVLERYLTEKLEKTGDGRWPYYLPNLKEFGIFVIRKDIQA